MDFQFIINKVKACDNLVRVGGFRDGGYVLPFSSIMKSKSVLSGGVGSNASFELDIMHLNSKIEIILIDKSFSILRMFLRSFYHLLKIKQSGMLSLMENFAVLEVLKRSILVRKFISSDYDINIILDQYNFKGNSILKLDIEGSEYEILKSIIDNQERFNSICIEFHDLNNLDNFKKLKEFIILLDLDIVFVSVNENCVQDKKPTVLEISFTRKEFLKQKEQDYLQASCSPGNIDLMIL